MILKDRTVVITGAGGGIGAQLVFKLLAKGSKVIAIDLREDYLIKLKDEASNDNLLTYTLDIKDKNAVYEFSNWVINQQSGAEIIINCAGIIQPFIKVNELNYEAIHRVMDVNFYGTLYITKAFLPHLLAKPEAHIVNVSSMGGFLPVPGQSIYGASKAAVKLLTESLYAEIKDTNVHVTVVFPGATNTNISGNSNVEIPSSFKQNNALKSMALSPETTAHKIISGIEKNKKQIFTGKDSKFMNLIYRINPVFATNFITKRMGSLLR